VVAIVALLVGAFGAGWVLNDDPGSDGGETAATVTPVEVEADAGDRPDQAPLDDGGTEAEPAAAVAEVVAPATVQIETASGVGSGVIYDPDGLILTAAHVVEGSDAVTVRLADGTAVDGNVVGADTDSDIGVVAIDGRDDLPVAVLAGSPPSVGDLVVAVGSPFALDQTVTAGIVSALDRPASQGGPTVGTIQIDAPINPGNSGGGLFDLDGRLIGIPTSILGPISGNVGIGFAVPVSRVRALLDTATAP
jgi:S1-C subfamily serine protease